MPLKKVCFKDETNWIPAKTKNEESERKRKWKIICFKRRYSRNAKRDIDQTLLCLNVLTPNGHSWTDIF